MLALASLSGIPILAAVMNAIQIPSGTYPSESAHLDVAPASRLLHALAGTAVGIVGPGNFDLALLRRFG